MTVLCTAAVRKKVERARTVMASGVPMLEIEWKKRVKKSCVRIWHFANQRTKGL